MANVVKIAHSVPTDDAGKLVVQRLRALGEEAAQLAGMLASLQPSAPKRCDPSNEKKSRSSAEVLRSLIEMRRLRAIHVADQLFSDPAWDMLLDLLDARLKGQQVPISSLCVAADVPPTTALRRINMLSDRGLIVRVADPDDRRRVLVELTDEAESRLLAYLNAVRKILN